MSEKGLLIEACGHTHFVITSGADSAFSLTLLGL
jgi:hypothetical protein